MRYKTELKIKMTAYNKLKIAILAIIASQNLYAITIDPIQIQSAPGELLYAEMNFHQAEAHSQIQASLATAEDITMLGVTHQPPGNLNFFTRRDNDGNGVITITSSRPLTEAELNIIVKIQEDNATRLQHIKTPLQRNNTTTAQTQIRKISNEQTLKPITIVNEKDIALLLPESTPYPRGKIPSTVGQAFDAPLATHNMTPPNLNTVNAAPTVFSAINNMSTNQAVHVNQAPPATQNISATQDKKVTSSAPPDPFAKKDADSSALKKTEEKAPQQAVAKVKKIAPSPQKSAKQIAPASTNTHTVQSKESLWSIASHIATAENKPIAEVIKQIKVNNQHAFVHGDVNRLRRGVTLNLNTSKTPKDIQKSSAAKVEKIQSKQSGKAKYRLNQAEMSLIAEKEQNSANGSSHKNVAKHQTSNELSLKVMTSREKTVKLQKNVTQLELSLHHKDHRIQLLNARLAQLQQQLKAQQIEKKPTH